MRRCCLPVFVLSLLCTAVASADPRPFTFTYDTYPVGKGNFEYEQWITWQAHKEDDTSYDRIDFRHEFEFGITDNFDLAVYLPNWYYEDSKEFSGTKFDTVSVEGVVYFSNPVTDKVGLGLYTEISVGEEELEIENKLLVQKDIGKWVLAYNLVLETEIEGIFNTEAENEVEGVLEQTAGVSYAVAPGWMLGAEIYAESVYEDWSSYEHTSVWAGPCVNYTGKGGFFVTLTPVYQLTDTEDEPDFKLRMISGFQF